MLFNFVLVNNSAYQTKVALTGKNSQLAVDLAPHTSANPSQLFDPDPIKVEVSSAATRWNFSFQASLGGSDESPQQINYAPGDGSQANVYQYIGPTQGVVRGVIFSFGPAFSSKSWMSQIEIGPDDTIADIVIPGTHDSGTWNGNSNDQCQTMDIQEQLDAGIRWLDLRLAISGNDLEIYHARSPQNVYLGKDILPVVKSFLSQHPTETVILCVKHEGVDDAKRDFDSVLHGLLIAGLTPNTLYDQIELPRVSDVRGCVVLMRRDDFASFGIRAMGWPPDGTGTFGGVFFSIQDAYGYNIFTSDAEKIAAKWRNVEVQLEAAVTRRSGKAWYINFTSASSAPVTKPITFAEGVNPLLFNIYAPR